MSQEGVERRMFGKTLAQVVAEKPAFVGPDMMAMSILSDVQELILRSRDAASATIARQWINKAKYWIEQTRQPEPPQHVQVAPPAAPG